MKKLIAVLVIMVLALGIVACEKEEVKELDAVKVEIENGKEHTFEGVSIIIPEDYTEDEFQGIKLFFTDKYPEVTDNINIYNDNKAITLDECSREALDESYKQSFDAIEDASYEILDYEVFKIDGRDSVKSVAKTNMYDVEMIQTQYIVILDNNYVTITFTDASGQYTDEFKDIASTISVK